MRLPRLGGVGRLVGDAAHPRGRACRRPIRAQVGTNEKGECDPECGPGEERDERATAWPEGRCHGQVYQVLGAAL